AIQDATLAIVTHGREIEINRAELKRKTREVSLATGVNLLQIEMNYHNVLWQRTLEAAKAIQDAGISVFKAKIDRYNAAVELYKTDASVFAQRVQAEIAKVEVFKAQVEAYLAKVQVQKGQIEIYVAQVNACNTLVELYNAELKGAEIFYSVQKTKLEAFKIQMDAYLMEYQIKELEYKIWAMGIEGDATKLKAYQLELESYKEMLGGVKTKAEISMMNVNAQIATGELDLKAYSEKLAQFSEVIKLTSLNNGMKLDKWKGNIDMWKASLDARLKQEVANVQRGEANSRTVQIEVAHRIEKVKVSLERLKAQADLKLKAAVSGSEIYSRIASGALSMVTTMAAISHTTTATG
ncbi:MAG: hypothetical protein HQL01_12870, partial [Nitrospirae bacterium]|nr:hypothetical protein [Nitrospirota bacterium]